MMQTSGKQRRIALSHSSGSCNLNGPVLYPPPDFACIGIERFAKLPAHLVFLKRNMHPIRRAEGRDRSQEHWPRAHPGCDAKSDDHQTQVHRVPREAERAGKNKLGVCRREWVEFSALALKLGNRSDSQSNSEYR